MPNPIAAAAPDHLAVAAPDHLAVATPDHRASNAPPHRGTAASPLRGTTAPSLARFLAGATLGLALVLGLAAASAAAPRPTGRAAARSAGTIAARPGRSSSPHPAGIGSGPTVQSAYAGFTDVNGNGVLDCGEPVDLIASFATNNSGTPALAGSLFAPVNGTSGITFLHGSVVIDPDLTNGCTGTIVSGNGPTDSDFRVDFSCPADPIDNNSWTLVVRYHATYSGTTTPPSFSAGAVANLTNGATYSNVVTVPAGTACGAGGIPTEIALTKSASGPATPGSLLVYTITATDRSGAGDGGVQLAEVVPPHTTFTTTGSSPGWTCTPAAGASGASGGAGSSCHNPIGNLPPNGSVATFFAVTLDPTLPAAPVAIPNTACADAGTTLAGCASTSTPAAGTPTLHLAKSLAAGTPATAVPGATLAYTLAAANTGNQDLADATLQETVPANTTFAPGASSTGWTCTGGQGSAGGAGATCTLDLGALPASSAAGAAATRTFAVTVADPLPALPAGYLLANTACLQTLASGVAASCSTVDTPVTAEAVLHAVKTLRAGTGAPGSVLLYDLAVQNTGNEDATTVLATETVPANTTFATAAAAGGTPGWSCTPATGAAGATCTLAAGPLVAGATTHVLFPVTIDLPLAAGVTAIANTACFQLAAVLESAARRSTRAGAQGIPRFGAQSASALRPLSQAGASAGSRSSASPGSISQAGASPTCDTLSTPTQGQPLVALAKSYSGPPAAAGALLPFQLTATNTGNQDAAAVTLSETVPAHTTFAAAQSTAGWTCTPAAGTAGATCTLALGPLAGAAGAGAADAAAPRRRITASRGAPAITPRGTARAATQGASITATFALRVDPSLPGGVLQIANTACAAATGLAPACSQTATPPPTGTPQLAAELTYAFVRNALGNGLALAGDILTYSLTATNPSTNAAAQSVVILIPLDPHLLLDTGTVSTTAGAVTAGNTAGATAPAVELPTLAPGASCTIRFDATVGPLPAGLRFLSTQATLSAANVPPTVSSDPSAAQPLQPTTTPVGTVPAAPPPGIQAIPTLATWGLLSLGAALAAVSLRRLRTHRHPHRKETPQ